jgi:membrane protein implicated in regulation of membrane protease activity
MNEMFQSAGCFSYSSFIVPPSSFDPSLIPHPFLSSLIAPRSSLFFILLLVGAGFVIACAVAAAMSRHQKSAGRPLHLEGRVGVVLEALEPEGAVLVDGELWRARARGGDAIRRGRVRVVGARGHWLEVEAVA